MKCYRTAKQIYVCTRTGPSVEKTKKKILRLPMTTIRISRVKACTRISKGASTERVIEKVPPFQHPQVIDLKKNRARER